MNIRDMECFLAVCENGSINYTAEKLYLSPQGLSNVVKRVEKELGVELFERTQTGLKITDYGRVFQKKARQITQDYHHALTELESMKMQKNGMVKFSSAFGILRYLTPDFITDFSRVYPDMHLDYIELPDLFVEEYVRDQKADIGITPCPDEDFFDEIPLFSTNISFVAHDQSRFYHRNTVSVREIAEEPLIMESDNFRIHRIMKKEFQNLDVVPNFFFLTSGFSLCYKICSRNLANTVTTDIIFDDMRFPNLRMIPFAEPVRWKVCMILRKNTPRTKTLDRFIDYTRKQCSKLVGVTLEEGLQ